MRWSLIKLRLLRYPQKLWSSQRIICLPWIIHLFDIGYAFSSLGNPLNRDGLQISHSILCHLVFIDSVSIWLACFSFQPLGPSNSQGKIMKQLCWDNFWTIWIFRVIFVCEVIFRGNCLRSYLNVKFPAVSISMILITATH